MRPESLVASASINIGLAILILWLFSILKKQPSNAPIYFPRRLSNRHPLPLHTSLSINRFLPSLSWILCAFRVSQDHVLLVHGLDALVLIRLFSFGINFFLFSSFVGALLLFPVDYYNNQDQDIPSESFNSMDALTISNVTSGSNRLWVHFLCLCLTSFYGLYLLHKEYCVISIKRTEQLRTLRHRPDQFTVIVRKIPLCDQHKARSCCTDHFFSRHYPFVYDSSQILYDGKDLEFLLEQVKSTAKKIEDMKEKYMLKRQKGGSSSLEASHQEARLLASQEEKLFGLSQKIRQLQNAEMLKTKELPVAFVKFRSRYGAALAAQTQQHPNPLRWTTEMAPEPRDVSWRNLTLSNKALPLHKIGVVLAAALLTLFFAIPVTAVQGIAKYEKLKRWFPPAMAVELIPGLSSVITGYLPSAILKGFLYSVPYAMLGIANVGGSISKSKQEIKACNMVFYFLVGNVFFLSLISGSLLEEVEEYFTHPRSIPNHLARAVTAQADFFVTYILTDGLSGFTLEILQLGLLIWNAVKILTFGRGKEKTPYLFPFPYFRVVPTVALSIMIGMVYASVAPMLLPFLVGYFCLGYVVYINQLEDVYETIYDTCGRYWPFIHHYIFVSMILMQVTMVGLFGLKLKPAAAVATIPLLFTTIMFNEYCKIRFLPSFRNIPIQTAVEIDELGGGDEPEIHQQGLLESYRQPCLEAPLFTASNYSFSAPLIQVSS